MSIIRTRVADDTWVFTSRLYVEVNAGLVVTPVGGILIDTLQTGNETGKGAAASVLRWLDTPQAQMALEAVE